MQDRRSLFVAVVVLAAGLVCGCATSRQPGEPAVRGWRESIVIPTYPVGPVSDVPLFGQTDQIEIYPYTMQDDLSMVRRDEEHETYVLENEYLRITVLPKIGGRLFAIYDKVTGQDVLYRQVSIKPAWVALRGAWICGGIEWNFPDGHIVTTHEPVSCMLVRHDDGSASIVVGDTERIFRMSWTVVLTLHPGRAYVDTRIVCHNRTPYRHRFAWWSNAAFPATEQTQMIFPVQKVTGHGGHGLRDWPMRSDGDASWYKYHRGATSIFRAAGEEDFIAAYDHGSDVGLGQYADRRLMPGRKFWSWGVSDSGKRWATILSDDNRPYVELQSGRPLLQNEWLYIEPHEVVELQEYWMPITRIGAPARLNTDAVVRLTVRDYVVEAGVLPTRLYRNARIEIDADGLVLKRWRQDIWPGKVFLGTCRLPSQARAEQVRLRVYDASGSLIIAHQYGHYQSGEDLIESTPWRSRHERDPKAKTAAEMVEQARKLEQQGHLPQSIDRLEQGLEQFANDGRVQLAAGIATLKQGLGQQSRTLLRAALTWDQDGVNSNEARYYLGLAEARCGGAKAALTQWDAVAPGSVFGPAAAIEAARVLIAAGQFAEALDRLAAMTGGEDSHPWALLCAAVAWRQLGQADQARPFIEQALQCDPLMLSGQVELALLDGRALADLPALRDRHRRIEAATVYMSFNQHDLADRLLEPADGEAPSATALYLRAWVAKRTGDADRAKELWTQAARATVRGDTPSRLEELAAFEAALQANPDDANAHYLAGLVLFAKARRDQAVEHWQRAIALRDDNALAHRCLAVTADRNQADKRIGHLKRAVTLMPDAAQLYVDLDEACREAGELDTRVEVLERAVEQLPRRTNLAHRLGQVYFDLGRYDEAVRVYLSRRFHVAEARYELHGDYVMAMMGRAMLRLAEGKNAEALSDFDAASEYPENLNIGRTDRRRISATVDYWRGVALWNVGRQEEATLAWQRAARRDRLDRWMDARRAGRLLAVVHAALAQNRLGQTDRAAELLEKALARCEQFENYWPPHSQAFATMMRAFVAGAQGRPEHAGDLMNQAERQSGRYSGYVRLIRIYLSLLAELPQTQPASAPAQ